MKAISKNRGGANVKKISLAFSAFLTQLFAALPETSAQNWTVYNNLQYGLTSQETADLYLLNRGVNPAVVFIHGGGWQAGDKSAFAGYYARLYARAGFSVVSINYRLASYSDPTTQWNAQLQDAQTAIRWLRQIAPFVRLDPNRIAAVGDSAGAHLALFLGSLSISAPNLARGTDRSRLFANQSPKVSAVVDMFGPTNLTLPEMYNQIAPLALFGGRSFAEVPNLYRNASPIFFVNSASAPTCIVQGLLDTTVAPFQSLLLRNKLAQLGVPNQLITYSGGHWFSGLTSLQRASIDSRALLCISAFLHPNPANAL